MRQCWSTKGGGRAPRGKEREIEKESTDGCWIIRTEMDHPRGGKQGNAKWGKMRSPVCGLSNNANRLSHITVLFPLFQRLAQGVVSHYRGGGVRGLERGIGLSAFWRRSLSYLTDFCLAILAGITSNFCRRSMASRCYKSGQKTCGFLHLMNLLLLRCVSWETTTEILEKKRGRRERKVNEKVRGRSRRRKRKREWEGERERGKKKERKGQGETFLNLYSRKFISSQRINK